MPIGSPGKPTTIPSSQLQGCGGYQDHDHFFTESGDGALVMKVPGSPQSAGCVTTPNSKHCRTELREVDPNTGGPASWDPNKPVNRLFGRLSCSQTGDGSGTVIGQIHIDDSISSKPVCELYYSANGDLKMGVEQTRGGGNQILTWAGNVPVGQEFTYEIRYESNVLSVVINGGSPKVFSTYQLGAPRSYFKAGNYLQGSTASDVHFFEIRVQHDGTPAPDDPDNKPSSPSTGGSCDNGLDIQSDSTVSLKLFSGSDCCTPVETLKLGQLDSCHNANADFGSFLEAVGQDMFGQNIHVVTFEGRDCTGRAQESKLTNSKQCFANSNSGSAPFKSFMISAKGTDSAASAPLKACSVNQPAGVSDDNVAINLFSDSSCCDQFENIKLGKVNSCHDANNLPAGFKSFTQAVGQNMFGKGLHIVTYAGKGCTGTATSTKLTNAPTCYDNAASVNTPFLSFMIADPGSNPGGSCNSAPPSKKSDNTVVVELFKENSCCTPVETAAIGNLDACHNADSPFQALKQAVGQNMFGRNIHIEVFPSRDCNGSGAKFSLSNKDVCSAGSQTYQSFRVASAGRKRRGPAGRRSATTC